MVKRTNTNIARQIDKTTLPDHASARQTSHNEKPINDDIIKSLSNAYENKRARQVFEWERAQVINVRRTA